MKTLFYLWVPNLYIYIYRERERERERERDGNSFSMRWKLTCTNLIYCHGTNFLLIVNLIYAKDNKYKF